MVGLAFCNDCHMRMFDEEKIFVTRKGMIYEDCFTEYKKDYRSPEEEIERLRNCIKRVMETTHDDNTFEFLDRVLIGAENDAPSYRIKMKDGE